MTRASSACRSVHRVGWKVGNRGSATLLELPEAGSWVGSLTWTPKTPTRRSKPLGPCTAPPRASSSEHPTDGIGRGGKVPGSSTTKPYPNERREAQAIARRSADLHWTVVIEDVSSPGRTHRAAKLIHRTLLPKRGARARSRSTRRAPQDRHDRARRARPARNRLRCGSRWQGRNRGRVWGCASSANRRPSAVDAGNWVFDLELVAGDRSPRMLTVRDEPHEHTFTER
jgi:hypothetical protein